MSEVARQSQDESRLRFRVENLFGIARQGSLQKEAVGDAISLQILLSLINSASYSLPREKKLNVSAAEKAYMDFQANVYGKMATEGETYREAHLEASDTVRLGLEDGLNIEDIQDGFMKGNP